MNRIKERVEGKTCFVLLGGASLEYLRRVAQDFKDEDICWCGMNFFTPAQVHILQSIGKKFSFVFDISGVENIVPYEQQCRIPRIEKYLEQEDSLFVSCKEVERNFNWAKRPDIFEKYKDKISYIEDIVDLNKIHNSLMAYLYLLTYCNVKEIYLFGCDGYQGEYIEHNAMLSYFSPIENEKDYLIGFGGKIHCALLSDTESFNGSFEQRYLNYCTEKELVPRRIYNVNPDSFITIFPRISLLKLEELFNEGVNNE